MRFANIYSKNNIKTNSTDIPSIERYIPVIPNISDIGANVAGTKAIPIKYAAVSKPAKAPRLSGEST